MARLRDEDRAALRLNPFFAEMPDEVQEAVFARGDVVGVEGGEAVFAKGEAAAMRVPHRPD